MIAGTIWTQLVATLENNPTLSGYIKFVYEGQRFDIEPDSLPCIMIEPISDGEIDKEMNEVQDIYLTLNLFAFSSANVNDFKKTIVGGPMYKGIFDINNDIRSCLSSSSDLGGRVIDIKLQTTQYDTVGDKYPVRGMLLPLRILYRQTNNV